MEKQAGQWAASLWSEGAWDGSAAPDRGDRLAGHDSRADEGPVPSIGTRPGISFRGEGEPPYPGGLFGWNQPLVQASVPPGSARFVDSPSTVDIYREVQRGAAFQQVRRRYRRFVGPAAFAFLLWYFGYVVAVVTAPGLMARPVIGALNVALLAGLAQFLTTFLLTWAYAGHARRYRDRAALELRWTVYERAGAHRSAAAVHDGSHRTGSGAGR
ncbi:DUF485 domain-containing protein [Streptomyces sp. NPDC056500]|uniref:DUF485 domain-containing protein n=1 Tax=Streptomyces sp. NPDC056500 TaxID=3345840 RepID=UPI0036A37FD7